MSKSPEMEEFLEDAAIQLFGRSRKVNACVSCGSDKVAKPEFFNDSRSWEEWKLSRWCQKCQDEFWEAGDEEE